jgi:hypothetical protein
MELLQATGKKRASKSSSQKALEKFLLPPLYIPRVTWKNPQSTGCVLGGKSRVKVLLPDPQLLRLGQLLEKPRGVIPKENNLSLELI